MGCFVAGWAMAGRYRSASSSISTAWSAPAGFRPIQRETCSAGIGLMLATQSPGDLDYRCRDTIRTWFVGRVKENTALAKMKPMLSEARVDATGRIATQETGEFHVLRDGKVTRVKADQACMDTAQLGEDETLRLAARSSSQGS